MQSFIVSSIIAIIVAFGGNTQVNFEKIEPIDEQYRTTALQDPEIPDVK